MLSLDQIEDILYNNAPLVITDEQLQRVQECYDFLQQFKADKVIYGINTGFGPMAQYRVADSDLEALQYGIIRSHSTGAGEAMPLIAVKAAMVSRIYTFLQFKSAISVGVVKQLQEFINRNIIPFVPQHGSVGASGDLVQLAHIALTLIGEGFVFHNGQKRPTDEVLAEVGLKPLKLMGRDGLSLVNGTAMMTGLGLVNYFKAKNLLHMATQTSLWINEVVESYDDFLSPVLNNVRRQNGQNDIANLMRNMASDSANPLMQKREVTLYNHNTEVHFKHKVQAYYSLRCTPQILGPILDSIKYAGKVLEREVNSADDNPIVDPESQNVYHGGNFHGDYISLEMDKLKIVITKLTMLCERQINYLYHDKINEMLPPFVNLGKLGLDYGMQACQFTATSTTAECQTLSMPNYVHSIPNNNDNQDVVSMGTNSALLTAKVIENAQQVMAILLMSLAQATDCRQRDSKEVNIKARLCSSSFDLYNKVREVFPCFTDNHPHYLEIEQIIDKIINK